MSEITDKCPCRLCKKEERYEACWGSCQKYLKWQEENKKINQKKKDEQVITSGGWGYIPRKKNG